MPVNIQIHRVNICRRKYGYRECTIRITLLILRVGECAVFPKNLHESEIHAF
jgi:hypothetical protein